jgi:23S rRNA (adenine2503-C2)-methyltransferase
MINLQTIQQDELEGILTSWGHPKYRAKQIYNWVRVQGVTNVDDMQNIPKKLKQQLKAHASEGSLKLAFEQVSKDGTRKRAYQLPDGQLIESVLMPYRDGRYTACISSQAGCAQGCVFCATGQMGFSRQLTADEIFEQVARFASELAYQDKHGDDGDEDDDDEKDSLKISSSSHNRETRLSNIVFMGMGEPLANYRNVVTAVKRIQSELGIGHRKITVSTVGIVPNIEKLAQDLPQVRLAVSLHCASDEERNSLIPANLRYGGLDRLMETLREYSKTTGKRITLEWALIEHENDTPETAHKLGKLVKKWLRPDMVHINVIPLNPTGGFGGNPSGRSRVDAFCAILEKNYRVACTPRVRRGIDIDAGCGQLTAVLEKKKKTTQEQQIATHDDDDEEVVPIEQEQDVSFAISENVVELSDEEDWEDYEYSLGEKDEVARLLSMVKDTVVTKENEVVVTGSITDSNA